MSKVISAIRTCRSRPSSTNASRNLTGTGHRASSSATEVERAAKLGYRSIKVPITNRARPDGFDV